MEVTAGIEPAYTALQAAASPLRHVTSERQKSLVIGAVYKWLNGRCNIFSHTGVFAAKFGLYNCQKRRRAVYKGKV